MKNRGKRLIVLLLSVFMVLSQMSMSVFAFSPSAEQAGDDKDVVTEQPAETPGTTETGTSGQDETNPEVPASSGQDAAVEEPASTGGEGALQGLQLGTQAASRTITVKNELKKGILLKFTDKNQEGEYEREYPVDGSSSLDVNLISLDEIHSVGAAVVSKVDGTAIPTYKSSEETGYDYCIELEGNVDDGRTIVISPAWTIKFDPNGADRGSMGSQLIQKGTTASLNMNTFEKDGYTFDGWSKDAGAASGTYSDGGLFRATENTTLYAVWTKTEHQHHWVTTVEGTTVTIKCNSKDCPIEQDCVFKLNTPGKTYDGVPYGNGVHDIDIEQISGQVPEGFEIPDETAASDTGIRFYDKDDKLLDEAPTDAGENYWLKASLMYEGSKVAEIISTRFDIEKAPLTVKADPKTKQYGEDDPELTYTVKGLVNKEKAKDVLSGDLVRGEGEKVGSYTIGRGTLVSNDNYNLTYAKANFTITKAVAEIIEDPEPIDKIYDGKETPIMEGGKVSEDCKLMYSVDGGEFTDKVPSAKDVKTYQIDYKAVPKKSQAGNYDASDVYTTYATITKNGVTAPVKIPNLVYSGEPQALVTAGSTDSGKMYYRVANGNTWSEEIPTRTDADSYTVDWAVFTDGITDADHLLDSGKLTASIGKYQLTEADITAPEVVSGLKFTGNAQTLITAGQSELATFIYKVGDSEQFINDLPSETYADTYEVYYRAVPKDTKNYAGFTCDEPIIASIGAKEVKAYWGERELTYNGQEQVPAVTVKADDGKTLSSRAYTVTGQAKNAGHIERAEVTLTNDNYVLTGSRVTAFTINPKPVSLIWSPTPATFPYDGEAHQATAVVNDDDVVSGDDCSVDSSGYTIRKGTKKVDSAKTAGTYTVTVGSKGLTNNNYKPSEEAATKEFTITKAVLVTDVQINGWTYGEDPNEPSVTNNPEKSEVTYEYLDGATGEVVDPSTRTLPAGFYKIEATVAESANYEKTVVSKWFTVAKADAKVSVSIDNWFYGENPDEPEVVCNIPGVVPKISYYGEANDGSEYFVSSETPVKAGTYCVKAEVTETGDYSGEAAIAPFTIYRGDPNLTIIGKGWTYGDKVELEKQFDVTALYKNLKYDDLHFFYYNEESEPVEINTDADLKTIDAGRVTIGVSHGQTSNYTSDADICEVTIAKADLPFDVVKTTDNTYALDDETGEAVEHDLAKIVDSKDPTKQGKVPKGVKVEYRTVLIDKMNGKVPTASAAGSHPVWYRIDGGKNYKSVHEGWNVIPDFYTDIAKASTAGTKAKIEGWTYGEYDEEENAPSVKGLPSDYDQDNVTYVYAPRKEGQAAKDVKPEQYSEEVPEDAGLYAVKAIIGETSNYEASESMPCAFEIEKASMNLTVTAEGWTYGEDPVTPVAEGNVSGEETKFWYWSTVEGKYPGSYTAPTAAGTYYVNAVVDESENYESASSTTPATFTIAKADPFSGIYVEDWTYGKFREANMPQFEDLPEEINKAEIGYKFMQIDESDNPETLRPGDFPGNWITEADLKTAFGNLNVGEYAVIAWIKETDNYNEVVTDVAAFEVTKADASYDKKMLPTGKTNLKYTGDKQYLFNPLTAEQEAYWCGTGSDNDLYWAVTTVPVRPLSYFFTKMDTPQKQPNKKSVNTFYVWLRVVNPNTSSSSVTRPIIVTIHKADLDNLKVDIEGWTYGEKANKPTLTGNTGEGSVSYRYVGETASGKDYDSEDAPKLAGQYKVVATVESTENYNGKTVEEAFEVAKQNLTVTADSNTKVYDGKALTDSGYKTTGTLRDNDYVVATVSGSQTYVADKAAENKVTSVKVFHTSLSSLQNLISDVTDNYQITKVSGELEVTKRPVTITADSASQVYNGKALTKQGASADNLVAGDTLDGVVTEGSQTDVGERANTIVSAAIKNKKGDVVTSSYERTLADGTLKVRQRLIWVYADDKSKTYGDADPELTYTADELVGTDTFTGSIERESGKTCGEYAIKQGTLTAGDNYEIVFGEGTFTISKRTLKIIAQDKSKVYGEADPELTYETSGLVPGDHVHGSLKRDPGEDSGVYAIRQGSLTANDNYDISFTGATFTIIANKAALVDAIAQAQSYYNSIKDSYADVAATLLKAIQQAQKVAGMADASQSSVNSAVFSTQTAVKTATDNVSYIEYVKAANNAAYAPGYVKLNKVSKGSKRLTATFKKVTKNITGYQVMVTNLNTGEVKIVNAKQGKKSAKKINKTVKKLAKKTKYNVQVRGYNVVNSQTYFGPWSNVKTAKTR